MEEWPGKKSQHSALSGHLPIGGAEAHAFVFSALL